MKSPDGAADEVRSVPRLRRVLGGVLLTVIAGIVAYFTWPSSLGGCTTLTIVNGHSMEPTYHTDDIVVSRCGAPQVGDVAVYATEGTGWARIVHRVIGGDGESGWEFQGDNNDWVDDFHPTDDEIVGVVVLHVPKVGKVAKAASSPLVWASLFTLAFALIVWPSRDDEHTEPALDPELEREPEPQLVPSARVVDDFRMEDLDAYIAARAAEPLPEDDDTAVLARSPFDLDWLLADDAALEPAGAAGDDWWTDEIERLVFPNGRGA